MGVAVEQAAAGLRFEPAHLLAHRRLTQAAAPRGLGEGAGLGDGEKGHEQIRIIGLSHHGS